MLLRKNVGFEDNVQAKLAVCVGGVVCQHRLVTSSAEAALAGRLYRVVNKLAKCEVAILVVVVLPAQMRQMACFQSGRADDCLQRRNVLVG